MDEGDCVTSLANAVGKNANYPRRPIRRGAHVPWYNQYFQIDNKLNVTVKMRIKNEKWETTIHHTNEMRISLNEQIMEEHVLAA